LLRQTLVALKLVRLVQKLFETESIDTVVQTRVFLDVKRQNVELLTPFTFCFTAETRES
jgi:hypothetical protein